MKAFVVVNDGEFNHGSVVVFAPSISEAKKKYKDSRLGEFAYRYVDLRVKRLKVMDGKEDLNVEELTLALLEINWFRNNYPYIEDGLLKGYVTLNKGDLEGIKLLGLQMYLRAKNKVNSLKLSEFEQELLERISKKQEWLVRNKDGSLLLFEGEKPNKDLDTSDG